MKKLTLKLLCAAFLTVSLVACGGGETADGGGETDVPAADVPAVVSDAFLGTWHIEGEDDDYIVINEGGTLDRYSGCTEKVGDGTWEKMDGGKLAITMRGETREFDCTVTGDKMTLTFEDRDDKFDAGKPAECGE